MDNVQKNPLPHTLTREEEKTVDYYLIIARSITYAQRMAYTLERVGVWCQIFRAPMGLTERGCAYAVRIRSRDLTRALQALREANLQPVQVYVRSADSYREVRL